MTDLGGKEVSIPWRWLAAFLAAAALAAGGWYVTGTQQMIRERFRDTSAEITALRGEVVAYALQLVQARAETAAVDRRVDDLATRVDAISRNTADLRNAFEAAMSGNPR